MSKLQAVILTGARNSQNPLLIGTGLQSKVLLPVGGQPMVQRVLETVASTRYQPSMYISTNDPVVGGLRTSVPFAVIPSENTAVQSFVKSIERVQADSESPWVLFASGDHPLLTAEMIEYFIDDVMRRDLTLGVAVVNKSMVQQHYPRSRRTYFAVKNGAYSGGNLYLINKPRFLGNTRVLETIDGNRKAPWKSIKLLDPISMAQVAFRQLTMHQVADKAAELIGCKTGIVDMPFAECCMDVDKPSDKEIAEIILARRAAVDSPTPVAVAANPA